jgi:hypothetical protein
MAPVFIAMKQLVRNVLYVVRKYESRIDTTPARWSYDGPFGIPMLGVPPEGKRDHAILRLSRLFMPNLSKIENI